MYFASIKKIDWKSNGRIVYDVSIELYQPERRTVCFASYHAEL